MLALLTIAWLNVALQPCAMAMAGDSGCHHVSPHDAHYSMSAEAASAHGHVMVDGHAEDHDARPEHGTDGRCRDCSGELADCAHLDSINKNDRNKPFSPDPGIAWLVLPSTADARPVVSRPPPSSIAGDPARMSGAFPPLNVLYCVYLD